MSASELAENRAAELGYRESGARELALRDWYSLREPGSVAETPKEFAKVIAVLRTAKWQKDNPEKKKANALKHYRKPGVAERQVELCRKRRHERHRAAAPVIACAECGALFCEVRPRGGVPRKFCGERCGTRWKQREVRRQAGAHAINCRTCGQPGHNSRRHKWWLP